MNDEVIGLLPLYPQETNSTFFTQCCKVAICDDQLRCPKCNKKVIGWDSKSNHGRSLRRWQHAYRPSLSS